MTHGRLLLAADVTDSSSCKPSVMECRLDESKRNTPRSHDARSAAPLPAVILSISAEFCSERIRMASNAPAQQNPSSLCFSF